MISDQNCMTQSSITSLYLFWNCKIPFLKYRIFSLYKCFIFPMLSWSIKRYKSCFSFSYHLICSFLEALKSDWLFCFSKAVSLSHHYLLNDYKTKVATFHTYLLPKIFFLLWQQEFAQSADWLFLWLCCRVMAVPNTMIYFTLYDQLKVVYGFKEGEENFWSPMCAGVTARSNIWFLFCHFT